MADLATKKPKSKKSCKGRMKKRFFLRCTACSQFCVVKEFSVRWNPKKIKPCRGCGGELRTCTRKEESEAKSLFIVKPRRKKGSGNVTRQWYHETYLQSEHWQRIRARVLHRDGGVCQVCGYAALIVHHKSYEPDVMAGYRDDLLISLCGPCHTKIEFDGKTKLNLKKANRRLESLLQMPKLIDTVT